MFFVDGCEYVVKMLHVPPSECSAGGEVFDFADAELGAEGVVIEPGMQAVALPELFVELEKFLA